MQVSVNSIAVDGLILEIKQVYLIRITRELSRGGKMVGPDFKIVGKRIGAGNFGEVRLGKCTAVNGSNKNRFPDQDTADLCQVLRS